MREEGREQPGSGEGPSPMSERPRVPPGQVVTQDFPVLTAGPVPRIDLEQWRLRLFGLVERETELTWDAFMALPQTTVVADFHCVTQWSRLDNRWTGVSLRDVLAVARPRPEAQFVLVHCYGGYITNLPLATLMQDDVLLAHQHDGKPLTPEHGWPLRLVVPSLYVYKSAKWVSGLQFRADDVLGFYERRGYHVRGDPWREERFWPELPADLAITLAICGVPPPSADEGGGD